MKNWSTVNMFLKILWNSNFFFFLSLIFCTWIFLFFSLFFFFFFFFLVVKEYCSICYLSQRDKMNTLHSLNIPCGSWIESSLPAHWAALLSLEIILLLWLFSKPHLPKQIFTYGSKHMKSFKLIINNLDPSLSSGISS